MNKPWYFFPKLWAKCPSWKKKNIVKLQQWIISWEALYAEATKPNQDNHPHQQLAPYIHFFFILKKEINKFEKEKLNRLVPKGTKKTKMFYFINLIKNNFFLKKCQAILTRFPVKFYGIYIKEQAYAILVNYKFFPVSVMPTMQDVITATRLKRGKSWEKKGKCYTRDGDYRQINRQLFKWYF